MTPEEINAAFAAAEEADAVLEAAKGTHFHSTRAREAVLRSARDLVTALAPFTGLPTDDGGPGAQARYCKKGKITHSAEKEEFTFAWVLETYDYGSHYWGDWEPEAWGGPKNPHRTLRFPARWLGMSFNDVRDEAVAAQNLRIAEKARFRKMVEDAVAAKAAAEEEAYERAEFVRLAAKYSGRSA